MTDLTGKTAIVTGAAQGIGARFAHALANAGANVAICDLGDPRPVADAITAAGGNAIARLVDVTDSNSVQDFVAATHEAFGGPHILVNNAAISGRLARVPLDEIESADWDRIMQVNVRGAYECLRAALPHMRAQGYGKVINMASNTALEGRPHLLHYVTSKGAVIAMSKAMARELGPQGIRVNCIAPGLTLSDNVRANPIYTEAVLTGYAAGCALGRNQVPEDLIGMLLFLSSPASDFITGQTMVVDGGIVMQ